MERVCPLNTRCNGEKTSCTLDKPQTTSERASELYLLASLSGFFNTSSVCSWPQRGCIPPVVCVVNVYTFHYARTGWFSRLIIFFRRQRSGYASTILVPRRGKGTSNGKAFDSLANCIHAALEKGVNCLLAYRVVNRKQIVLILSERMIFRVLSFTSARK